MRSNQLQPIAGMLTAVLLLAVITGTYLYATQTTTEQPEWSELSDEEKLAILDRQEQQRTEQIASERAELYDNAAYCDRISDDNLRARCKASANATSGTRTTGTDPASGASTLEPLQNVSSNDERRFNRAELYDDPAYCDEITDDDLRLYCYNELT